jgi:hypothetical protein
MKTRIAMLLLSLGWAIVGCAGSDEFDDTDAGLNDPVSAAGSDLMPLTGDELGTSSEALTVATNMGVELDFTRCAVPWVNSECLVPQTKSPKYSSTCPNCSTDMTNSFTQGKSKWHTALVGQGWQPSPVSPGTAGEYISLIKGAVPGGEINSTSFVLDTTSQGGGPGPGGNYRKITHCTVTVDLDKDVAYIAAHPPDVLGGCGAGTACRLNMFQNHIQYGLGLCTGMGKTTDRNSVMSGPAFGAISMGYSASDKANINTYQP